MKYAIKHLPSNKFLQEDDQGTYLVDEQEAIVSWTLQESVNSLFGYLMRYPGGMVYTDNGDFPINEFEAVAIK
jgi:hypothetical protein